MIATTAIARDLAPECALRASTNLNNPVLALAAGALELP
jgi:hypothetical protein